MEAINFVVQINVFVLSHLRDFRSRDIPVYTRSVCFHLFRPHSNSLGDMWIYRRPNIPQGRPEWSHTWCTSVSGSAELNCCKKKKEKLAWGGAILTSKHPLHFYKCALRSAEIPPSKRSQHAVSCKWTLHKVKALVVYHLHGQIGRYTVWANTTTTTTILLKREEIN